MPYPEDPFALIVKTGWRCLVCLERALVRTTKDQNSPWLGQVVCQACGYTNDLVSFRAINPVKPTPPVQPS